MSSTRKLGARKLASWRFAARRPSARAAGFTLLELMMVIAIIMILAGMLMPALNVAKQHANDATTRARIMALSDGATTYAHDNNNLYPGQWNMGKLQWVYGAVNANSLFGSQALAMAMFGLNANAPSAGDAKSNYAPYQEGDLITISRGGGRPDVEFALWDRRPDTRNALLYYPYIPSVTDRMYRGNPDPNFCFAEEHNWYMSDVTPGTRAAPWARGDGTAGFDRFFRDSFNQKFANVGTFIILAPGVDRLYGTADDLWNNH